MAAGHGGKLHVLVRREIHHSCHACSLRSFVCSDDLCELQHYEVADKALAGRERDNVAKKSM
jgi:hypothetical protein